MESEKVIPLKEYHECQIDSFLEVMELFVIPTECTHAALERRLSNPFLPKYDGPIDPCGIACFFCLKNPKSKYPIVCRNALRRALNRIFQQNDGSLTMNDAFVTALQNYPEASSNIYASSSKHPPTPKKIKMTILVLIATKLVTYGIVYNDSDKEMKSDPIIVAKLSLDDNDDLCIYDNSKWLKVPQIV
jgi:hypothetical protein